MDAVVRCGHLGAELFLVGAELLAKAGVRRAEDLHREKRGVRGAGRANGDSRDRNARGHLHRSIECVEAIQGTARDRNSNDRQNGRRGKYAAEMRGTASVFPFEPLPKTRSLIP